MALSFTNQGIAGAPVMATVTLTLLLFATTVVGSIDCSTVTSLIAACSSFVSFGSPEPSLGTPCCNGVVTLYNVAADSVDNRRSACGCLMGLITTYNPNATAIARLPGLCGVSLGFTIDPNVDCRIIP
ncbi:putative non-specific lipid-transfer protein 14 [Ananas comosus]|uniref:Non-specific lipid-transfer protein n=1 Tax=Ananas comosus TaxID=4615 RepID=A0A6P5FNT1_ANACO|nr:putative non-specific lipid-transfer protein 14 [Ananas comosus]